ncbi:MULTISPECIES: aromatic aminobenezylarsenical efflux permease ArsG family transporter [Dysgonomonadaceae]|uniref:aromatic aminobenezylarsenical efflux permease ArsG family transporter n=1 Tax=Dysgonomonadaceae TaxID=2005520 RepID=UPI002AB94B5A|nr:aromatic aminobenezylarsenical efflux permease ArsG family transporter [Proteiniphilum sp.]MDY9918095.1 aromatic aminobenezylarsenical efflux permease ArsG family transporter [Proteiniphilum sp.]
MEWLQQLVDTYKNDIPIFAAFVLGLMTSISPCPLATNITATAYLSKDILSKKRVLLNSLFYTLGRMFSYTALGIVFYFGASQFKIAKLLQGLGGVWLGIALVFVGVLMLDIIKINTPVFNKLQPSINEEKFRKGYWSAVLLGVVFALAFCPFSGVLYFGVLIPMTIASATGLLLPPVFSIGTALPVIAIAVILAYSVANMGKFYNGMKHFEKWFKRIVAVVFLAVGAYYIIINI